MISLLVGESYINAFGRIFRQTMGVIMGGKSSGWLSDCSLMVDEFKYIDSKVKNHELDLARSFKGLNRYRDDCTALNIDNFITPDRLRISQTNTSGSGFIVIKDFPLSDLVRKRTLIGRYFSESFLFFNFVSFMNFETFLIEISDTNILELMMIKLCRPYYFICRRRSQSNNRKAHIH